MTDKYRIKAEKWDSLAKKCVSCRLILTAVFVTRIKDTRKIGEILSIEERR